jgi:hypothetical protein
MDYFRDFLPSNAILPKPDPINRAHGELQPGDNLFSATRAFRLSFQMDGNLVLYLIDDATLPDDLTKATYSTSIWDAKVSGKGGVRCVMQTDGNSVIYDATNRPLWNSGTENHPGAFLRMQDDGNIVWHIPNGDVVGTTSTDAGPYGPGGEFFGGVADTQVTS